MERVIYISGPITGVKNQNKPLFKETADAIRKAGLLVRNPHEFCADLPSDSTRGDYLRRCLSELTKCTEIIFLPGWIHSEGANIEYYNAKAIGIYVIPNLDVFLDHINSPH